MYGGENPTCIPKRHLTAFEKKYKRPCPHVILQMENRPLAAVAMLSLHEHCRWIAPLYFEAIADGLDADVRRAYIERLGAALRSEALLEVMYPKPKEGRGPEPADG